MLCSTLESKPSLFVLSKRNNNIPFSFSFVSLKQLIGTVLLASASLIFKSPHTDTDGILLKIVSPKCKFASALFQAYHKDKEAIYRMNLHSRRARETCVHRRAYSA